jgi:hypothetical protein
MGTRSLTSIRFGGTYHTQYTQFDGYLSGRGTDFAKFMVKALPYLRYIKTHPERVDCRADEVIKAYLIMESLESGHGWRGVDDNGHDWSYQESATLKVEDLAGGIEFVRVLDLDEGTIAYYGGGLEETLFQITVDDFMALDYSGQDMFYKVLEYYTENRWNDDKIVIDLTFKQGKRNPWDTHTWAKKGDKASERDYITMSLNGKVIYASMFATATAKKQAEKNAKLFEKKVEEEATA